MHKSPLVSIIIPAFNCSEYIRDALLSVLNQTYKNIEVIVVDDNSSDGTVEILKKFDDKRLKVFINNQNFRIAKTLNKAIGLAQGKYIARMDCDDVCIKDRMQKQVDFLEQNENIDIVGSRVSILDKPKEVWFSIVENNDIKASTFFHCPICHPSVMYRAEFIKNNLYDENCSKAQDYELWERAASKSCNFYNLPEILLNYRLHENQISNTENNGQVEIANSVRKRALLRLFDKQELSDSEIAIHLSVCNEKKVLVEEVLYFYKKCIKRNLDINLYDPDAFKRIVSSWVFKQFYTSHNNIHAFFYYMFKSGFFEKPTLNLLFRYLVKSIFGSFRGK